MLIIHHPCQDRPLRLTLSRRMGYQYSMERNEKLALLNRQLGLRHKLKVHDSVPPPDAHDDQAKHWVARWEMEDEVNAIEEILRDARLENVANLRASIEKNGPKKKKKI